MLRDLQLRQQFIDGTRDTSIQYGMQRGPILFGFQLNFFVPIVDKPALLFRRIFNLFVL